MRIIGGRWRGLRLASVGKGDAAAHLRPTPDRVRESLFSVLEGGRFGQPLDDAVVLDLFAGTGALGLEALSRGAQHATFVENGRTAGKILASNIERTDPNQTQVLRVDARRLPLASGTPSDLVFLDPPYGKGMGQTALLSAAQAKWLAPSGLAIWEEDAPQEAPQGFSVVETKRYGQSWVTFLTWASS